MLIRAKRVARGAGLRLRRCEIFPVSFVAKPLQWRAFFDHVGA